MDSLAFSDEPLMPHCVMRRPVAGAELGLEDPGELMPRSVEVWCEHLQSNTHKQTKTQEKRQLITKSDKPAQCPA